VRDDLVESLRTTGAAADPDFHIFCGPPLSISALRRSFRRTICLCAWETDTIPVEWKDTLEHLREVWLPSEHNVSVFRRDLGVPVFCCPHALNPQLAVPGAADGSRLPHLSASDLVFYSIFAWQERKHPFGIIAAYLEAFPQRSDVCLIIKTRLQLGTRRQVETRIKQLRRVFRSSARVELVDEFWTEDQMRALMDRGDCYVSLHRGEGWCYPLFDAACRGTPVIATAYSGPLDYLDADHHYLIGYKLIPVRQRYVHYNPEMLWADPDLQQAAACMRNVYANRRAAKCRAQSAAERLQTRFSFHSIGTLAKQRLLRLMTS
jgi:glycosyltransferase involved in cell wall biosynthesis